MFACGWQGRGRVTKSGADWLSDSVPVNQACLLCWVAATARVQRHPQLHIEKFKADG